MESSAKNGDRKMRGGMWGESENAKEPRHFSARRSSRNPELALLPTNRAPGTGYNARDALLFIENLYHAFSPINAKPPSCEMSIRSYGKMFDEFDASFRHAVPLE